MKRGFIEAGIGFVRPAYLGSLMSLWREDGLKVIDLGRRAGLEPSTMTGLLDRMERDGLVERRPDPADRRVLKIFLTATGAGIRETVTGIVDSTLVGVAVRRRRGGDRYPEGSPAQGARECPGGEGRWMKER